MIMGCTKKVIVVRDIGSDMFDEAYFIVNPNVGKTVKSDFLEEANRIITSRTLDVPKKRFGRGVTLFLFIIGFLSGIGAGISAAVFLF